MPRKKREPSFDELRNSIEKMTKRQRQQLMTKIIKEMVILIIEQRDSLIMICKNT